MTRNESLPWETPAVKPGQVDAAVDVLWRKFDWGQTYMPEDEQWVRNAVVEALEAAARA